MTTFKQSQLFQSSEGEKLFLLDSSDKPTDSEKETPVPSRIQYYIDRIQDRDSLDFDLWIEEKTGYDPDLMKIYGAEFDVKRGLAVPIGTLGTNANNVFHETDKPNYNLLPFAFRLQSDHKISRSTEKRTRETNYATRKRLQHYKIQPSRCQSCGTSTIDGDTTVYVDVNTGVSRCDNIETCSSVWSCPVCRHKILNKRQDDLNHITEGYKTDGGNISLLTLTIPHKKGHSLNESKEGILDLYKRLIQSKDWARFKKQIGLDGYARALEVTYSKRNGFHPHLHLLLFHSDAICYELEKIQLYFKWKCLCSDHLKRKVNFEHGVDIREAQQMDYLAKWSGVSELTSQTQKKGKESSFTISQLETLVLYPTRCEQFKITLDQVLSVLYEYYTETKGNRLLTYSQTRYKDAKSLKDYYLREEQSDEEISTIQDEEYKSLIPVMSVSRAGYNEIYQHEQFTDLKDIAETVLFDTTAELNLIYECFIYRYPQHKKHIKPLKNYSEWIPKSKLVSDLKIEPEKENEVIKDLESCRYNSKLPRYHPNYIPF